jgi:hypothetical protein
MKSATFIRLLECEAKEFALRKALNAVRDGDSHPRVYEVDPRVFRAIPNSPFAYWVSDRLRRLFTAFERLESSKRVIRVGLATTSDPIFVRLWSEVSLSAISRKAWVPYAKGGTFSRYYQDVHLVVDWENNGRRIKERVRMMGDAPSRYVASEDRYFEPGLTYPRRTQGGFNVRVLPGGCIFANKGPSIFDDSNDPNAQWILLGLLNSSAFRALLSLQMVFGSYEVGVLQRTPVPDLGTEAAVSLGRLARECVVLKRKAEASFEPARLFSVPALLQVPGKSLSDRTQAWSVRGASVDQRLSECQEEIDALSFGLYGIGPTDRRAMEESSRDLSTQASPEEGEGEQGEDDETSSALATDETGLVAALVSYAAGCALGRWDVRLATGERSIPDLPDPFEPLPVSSPGMLTEEPRDYPVTIDRDGILPDDPDHPDDIVRRIHEVFSVIWRDNTEAIEQETCTILGVKHLRDYFRKPATAGFLADHIARYSKSRRKAPIYWLLQSSKKNYALWLYYHKLDKDRLFKALVNFVEPKIRLEDGRLETLRHQKAAGGDSGKDAKRFAKEIERQEDFLSELGISRTNCVERRTYILSRT